MKKWLLLISLICIVQLIFSQGDEHFSMEWGINADYSYSGLTNTAVLGPAFFWGKEKSSETGFLHAVTIEAGFTWSKQNKVCPLLQPGIF